MPVVSDYTAILTSSSWNGSNVTGRPTILTFSFNTSLPAHQASSLPADFLATFQAFSGAEQDAARAALQSWANACGIIFIEVPSGLGDLQFGKYQFALHPDHSTAAGFAYYPGVSLARTFAFDSAIGGDIFIDLEVTAGSTILLHEIGHAIGFKHPFDGDITLSPELDNRSRTVMSYTGSASVIGDLDAAAAQYVYGMQSLDGTHVASWSWNAATLTLTQTGGGGDDTIRGVFGSDIIIGGAGADILSGGGGNDNLQGDEGGDGLHGGAGDDTITGGAGEDYIRGDAGNDTLQGGSENDTLIGGSENDNIHGDAGADTCWGDAGNDSFSLGAGSDYINGGSGVDMATSTLSSSAVTLTRFSWGEWRASSGGEGVDSLYQVEYITFADRTFALRIAEGGVDSNGTSDILLRNASTGAVALWTQAGAAVTSAAIIGAIATSAAAVGSGDFNGDGRYDLLFRDGGGLVTRWGLDGATIASAASYASDPAWSVAGIGDFNGDFCDDILWRHGPTNLLAQWQMNGDAAPVAGVFAISDPAWSLAALADFNGDGRDDFLWRHSSGALAQWSLNGFSAANLGVFALSDTSWSVVGTGDFNGDLREDIMWRHTSGVMAIWHMDGTAVTSVGTFAVSDTAWSVSDIGDYNGDGRDDILWQGPDGTFALWTMNGFAVTSVGIIGNPGAGWSDI